MAATAAQGDTGYFSVSGGVLKNTLDASVWRNLYLSETDADHDLRFGYVRYSASGTAICILRYTDGNNQLYLEITPTVIHLRQRDGGTLTTLDTISTTVAQNTQYNVRAILDGANVSVYWGAQGGSFEEILSTSSATELTTTRAAWLRCGPNSEHGFDDIHLIAGTLATTQTFTYNDANEQVTSTVNGVTTDMTYDEWGRMTERDDGTHTATYDYRYGGKLYSVASDFPGEGIVTYETGGDGKRRSRIAGAEETWYNYTIGFDVVSTEDDADGSTGTLTRTYLGHTAAHVDGITPSSGTWMYYSLDTVYSVRGVWKDDRSGFASGEYTPFGQDFNAEGECSSISRRYTGHEWDPLLDRYLTQYRTYSPASTRWVEPDHLGMIDGPNVYNYVGSNPIRYFDRLGLLKVENCGDGGLCDDVKEAGKKACSRASLNRITDRSLRKCIKKKCKKGRVVCSVNCPPNTGGIGVPDDNHILLCVKNLAGLGVDYASDVILHEFAHTCGWMHGDGDGVPEPGDNESGEGEK